MAISVNVWADGFGVYHADVEVQEGDITPDVQLKALARKAIRAELGYEIGAGYRVKLVYTGMTVSASRPGVMYVTYKEA